jgi:dihydrofolate reductase
MLEQAQNGRQKGIEVGVLHVHEFMTLDGVIDAPEWSFDYGFSERQGETMGALTGACAGILLGRNTYEMFEPAWSTRTVEDDPGAPFFNDTMKYVVSSTLTDGSATWRNSRVLGPYDPDAIRELKDDVGNIYLSGSITLARALLEDGLVDELHLWVYTLTRPGGPRLFTDQATPKKLTLAASEQYDTGVLYLNLRKAD